MTADRSIQDGGVPVDHGSYEGLFGDVPVAERVYVGWETEPSFAAQLQASQNMGQVLADFLATDVADPAAREAAGAEVVRTVYVYANAFNEDPEGMPSLVYATKVYTAIGYYARRQGNPFASASETQVVRPDAIIAAVQAARGAPLEEPTEQEVITFATAHEATGKLIQ